MITEAIKRKIQDIVSVFETSSTKRNYSALVCLPDGPGGIKQVTYGAHQTTEYSHLRTLVKMYVAAQGLYSSDLESYVQFIGRHDRRLAHNESFKSILIRAGSDPVMQEVQDRFFDQYYWNPALNFFHANQFTLPLSMGVIYDSYIHSGGAPMWLRKKFSEKTPLNGGDEKKWITAYVNARDLWLEHHKRNILRQTDYRTDTWLEEIRLNHWDLACPVIIKFNSANKKHWVEVP